MPGQTRPCRTTSPAGASRDRVHLHADPPRPDRARTRASVYDEIRSTGLRYVGFKDIGLPIPELRALADAMRADGREVMLEVVSEDKDEELRSIAAALEIGVDWLLGGTHPDEALEILGGTPTPPRYCPFPGTVIGHPSLLRGTIEGIAADAAALTARPGVHGLDLLAYRFDGDVEALTAAVKASASGPVIAAGSRRFARADRGAPPDRGLGLHDRRGDLRGPLRRGAVRAGPDRDGPRGARLGITAAGSRPGRGRGSQAGGASARRAASSAWRTRSTSSAGRAMSGGRTASEGITPSIRRAVFARAR